ncbi:unnamed protein product [Discosporangium mesarthrocarpum]
MGGSLDKIMTVLFSGEKSESEEVDEDLAAEQAAELLASGVAQMGTDDDVFIEILAKQSRAQIQV